MSRVTANIISKMVSVSTTTNKVVVINLKKKLSSLANQKMKKKCAYFKRIGLAVKISSFPLKQSMIRYNLK